MKTNSQYKMPLSVSIILHAILLYLLFVTIHFAVKPQPVASGSQQPIIKAVTINQQQLDSEINKVKTEQAAKQKAKQEKLEQYQQKLKTAQQATQSEQKKLASLKAQQQKAQTTAKQNLAKLKQDQSQLQQKLKNLQSQATKLNTQKQQEQKAIDALKQKQAALKKSQLQSQQKQEAEKLLQQQLQQDQQELTANQSAYDQTIVNRYKALIKQAIEQQWLLPPQINKQLSCELLINLDSNGKVLSVQVEKSSGVAALDNSAVNAVYKASPLPVPKQTNLFNVFKQIELTMKPEEVSNA